ncbi:MAG: sensor histidine kinase [Bryobacteraceae bacterium]|nr:sensor histidine kinase [Bryobacteraceae bacterium]
MLLLIFLPGIAALRQSAQLYEEIRAIQNDHERTQDALFAIERSVPRLSVVIRDFLLDNSAETGSMYRRQFAELRSSIEKQMNSLPLLDAQPGAADRLRSQLDEYFRTIAPVFDWSPEQRTQGATYFLREQQRPRREGILAITDEISRLNRQSYRRRYEEIDSSQDRYRRQLHFAIAMAFLLGVAVALATIRRIWSLETRAEEQQRATMRAEGELRSLSGQLMRAQEDERRAISRELHDEVGQMLTGLRMELGALDKLRSEPAEKFRLHLEEAKTIAEQVMRTVRSIATGLRPSVLDLGLEAALNWQARHFSQRTGVPSSVQIDADLPALPETYLTSMYRIVQEALTNTARHSSATKVDIRVRKEDSALVLQVVDDGTGLSYDWKNRRGLGLIGMEERAREAGGTMSVHNGAGLTIDVRLPIPAGESQV